MPDALAKLRLIYPNLMRLDYDNRRTREDQQITAPERAENITPLEHLLGVLPTCRTISR